MMMEMSQIFRSVNIGKGFQHMGCKGERLRLLQGCGQDLFAAPGDLRKKGRGRVLEANKRPKRKEG